MCEVHLEASWQEVTVDRTFQAAQGKVLNVLLSDLMQKHLLYKLGDGLTFAHPCASYYFQT